MAAKDKDEEKPGKGHNSIDAKKAETGVKEILKAFTAMEADSGAHRNKIKELYEKHANASGMTRKNLRKEVANIRREQARQAEELEMEQDERDEIEAFRDAMKGTPFAAYVGGKLATRMN